ncbi:MAG: ComEC family competence protein [Phycisphaerales bacterium]|nr:ComEC family competence protein [Phycisphaerales bacterium]
MSEKKSKGESSILDRGKPWLMPAGMVVAGTALGGMMGGAWVWMLVATVSLGAGLWSWVRGRWSTSARLGFMTLILLAAGLAAMRVHEPPHQSIENYAGQISQLAVVRGTVVQRPVLVEPHRGAFARFVSWEAPHTYFVMQVSAIENKSRWQPCEGRLLVRLGKAETELQLGEMIEIAGWLSGWEGPKNPGEEDRRIELQRKGIGAQLSATSLANVRRRTDPLPPYKLAHCWDMFRDTAAQFAHRSLRLGLTEDDASTALLEALLLGRWNWELSLVEESFRRTGLVHLLSISGAHLGILLGLTVMVARSLMQTPGRVMTVVIVVLLGYLLILPMQVPIVRTAIMVLLLCLGFASGRKVGALAMVSLACLLVLLWEPRELWNPGFQLSYGLTAGLIAFSGPVSSWFFTPIAKAHEPWKAGDRLRHWGAGLLAANLVGFALAVPLVAYHFGMISVWAIPWSIVALPVVTALIGLGFVKILVGLIWPAPGCCWLSRWMYSRSG